MKARGILPKKQGWMITLLTIFMCAWVFASVIVSEMALGYLMIWILGKDAFVQPIWTAIYSALSYVMALVLVIVVPWKLIIKKGTTREEMGLRDLPTWTDIGLAPIGFVVSIAAAALLAGLFSNFSWFDAEQVQDVGFSVYLVGWDRIIAFITVVIVAPIAEELIFRGWLYGKLRARTSTKMAELASVLLSSFLVSLVFGLVHLQWNVGVNVFAMSMVLCVMREITGTIYSGILMHMIKNGVAFYLLYVLGVS